MPTDFKTSEALDRLYTNRQKAVDTWEAAVATRETARLTFETRSAAEDETEHPSVDELATFNAAETGFTAENDQYKAQIAHYNERIYDVLEMEKRREDARSEHRGSGAPARVVREPMTYDRYSSIGENGVSYYRDLAQVHVGGITFQGTDIHTSRQRLEQHAKEMDVEMPKRNRRRENNSLLQVSDAEMERGNEMVADPFKRGKIKSDPSLFRGYAHNPFNYRAGRGGYGAGYGLEQRVEPNSTPGQGGYFIPPLWLEDQWIQQLVAHLVIAGLCRQMDLPMGTNSINIPKVATGTAVGYQQANNSGVVTQDWTDSAVTGNVKTIAGQSDVARQLLEQSPNMLVDEVITSNLVLQYNAFLDLQVAAGDGLNAAQLNGGHIQGIANGATGSSSWTGVNAVTYTASAPAPWQMAQVFGAMASNVAKTRFSAGDYKTVTTPGRWFWYSTGQDANDRPLGETAAGGPYNVQAMIEAGFQAEGLVGSLPAVANTPAYIDANLPTNGGGSTNQDIAISGLFDDAWLFQGALRTNVFSEVLSGGLGIRFQAYNYVAFLLRYAQSFCIASGTGMVPPTGSGSGFSGASSLLF